MDAPPDPWLSIVVPTLNEGAALPCVVGDLRPLLGEGGVELIVADGGSEDDTTAVARSLGACVATAGRGRGRQLRAGVAAAKAPVLWILHADVRVPPSTLHAVADAARGPLPAPLACRLAIDSARVSLRCIAFGANLRSRCLALPYGDQGLLVRRAHLDAVGGFDDVPLMEDVALALRLRRVAPIRLLPHPLVVSARRWERDGPWRRSWRNVTLLVRYLRGADPAELVLAYERGTSPVATRALQVRQSSSVSMSESISSSRTE